MSKKLAFYSAPKKGMSSYYEMVDLSAQYGHETVEGYAMFEFATPDVEAAKKLKAYADQKGVKFNCFSIFIDLSVGDADAQIELLKRYADVTAALGCPYLHHTIIGECEDFDRVLAHKEEYFQLGIRAVRAVYDYAETVGVKAIYEPQGYIFNGVEGIGRLLKEVDRDIGIVCDVGNMYEYGETAMPFVKAFADKVCHVHIKDVILTPENELGYGYPIQSGGYMTEVLFGQGVVPIAEAIAYLKDFGYEGPYSIEYNPREEGMGETDACIAHLNEILGE